jgi:hippurate hydrolase
MELTLRYYSEDAIQKVMDSIKRICKAAAQMAGMPDSKLPEVTFSKAETPPVINNELLAGNVKEYAAQIIGYENIIRVSPAMVGEDFGKYGSTPENIPICLIWLGSTSPQRMRELLGIGQKPAPLHSPHLFPDYEKTILTGIEVMTGNVMGLMK